MVTGPRQMDCQGRFPCWSVAGAVLLSALVLGVPCPPAALAGGAPATPSGYLSRVGPMPVRLVTPARPVIKAPSPVQQPVAAVPMPVAVPEAPQFYGPPAPLVITESAPPAPPKPEPPAPEPVAPEPPPAAPLAPTTVSVAVNEPQPSQAITAQMLVRFFRNPAAGGLTNVPPQAAGGSETSLWMPVQFVPPQNSGPPPSSHASYQVTPPPK